MSVVDSLNDNCFVLATESLRQLCDAFEEEMDRRPTPRELAEILTMGAHTCAPQLTSVEDNRALTFAITARRGKRWPKPVVGDVIAVPLANGRVGIVVYIGKFGRHGEMVGVVDRAGSVAADRSDWQPEVVHPYPVIADLRPVTEGRWRVVAHRPDLVGLFREPEAFYPPEHARKPGAYGKFGLAESAVTDAQRFVTEAEASRIFRAAGKHFLAVLMEDQLVAYLEKFSS